MFDVLANVLFFVALYSCCFVGFAAFVASIQGRFNRPGIEATAFVANVIQFGIDQLKTLQLKIAFYLFYYTLFWNRFGKDCV